MPSSLGEFSHRTRADSLRRFREEEFDFLVIGGGITGAAVARDAAMRGLKVALVEKGDFAQGTSSKSSKLIHGGLRYLQNFEFHLVFEALAERALLMRTVPHMVRPLKFYFPIYVGDAVGKFKLGMGMWLYDILALFRAPGFHRNLSRKKMLAEIPHLKAEGLLGGFQYWDASMWDDALAVENLRAAQARTVAIANYVEAIVPVWGQGKRSAMITGFKVRDVVGGGPEFVIKANHILVCAGPWTDRVGKSLSKDWRPWLKPSKGVHLVFDAKRFSIPGALVMSQPQDGRISFVIPRQDYGTGVVIVGTTDGPTPDDPESARVVTDDVEYLMVLLSKYFPELKLTASDIVSAYVGVRPLFGSEGVKSLQKVSREHHIDRGPGGTTVVAGGKYTTSRKMAEEIIEFALAQWALDAKAGLAEPVPPTTPADTRDPINPDTLPERILETARALGPGYPEVFVGRYGAEARRIVEIAEKEGSEKNLPAAPDGFPVLGAQLLHAIRTGMVIRLEDFYLRRVPLFLARRDHGLPWLDGLAGLWANETGQPAGAAEAEAEAVRVRFKALEIWRG